MGQGQKRLEGLADIFSMLGEALADKFRNQVATEYRRGSTVAVVRRAERDSLALTDTREIFFGVSPEVSIEILETALQHLKLQYRILEASPSETFVSVYLVVKL